MIAGAALNSYHSRLKYQRKWCWQVDASFSQSNTSTVIDNMRLIDWAGFNVPLNTLYVISGTGFYGSDDLTNSVKALKEVVVLRIGFNPTRYTSPCYNTTQYTCIQCIQSYTHTEMNLCTVKWAQWDKNPIQRTVRSVHVCVHCTVHNCCTQYCTEQTW